MAASWNIKKHVLAAVVVLSVVGTLPSCRADCRDGGVRCRIPTSNWGSQVSSDGCSVTGGGSASIEGEAVTGTVSISGTCYMTYTASDSATYAYVGDLTTGCCYSWWKAQCYPCSDAGQMCNNNLAGCVQYPNAFCSATYEVLAGDTCGGHASDPELGGIAAANGLSYDDLLNLNQGIDCNNLQIGQRLCVAYEWGEASNLCEGYVYSGCAL